MWFGYKLLFMYIITVLWFSNKFFALLFLLSLCVMHVRMFGPSWESEKKDIKE